MSSKVCFRLRFGAAENPTCELICVYSVDFFEKIREGGKPDSVEGHHSSRAIVANRLRQPLRESSRKENAIPL